MSDILVSHLLVYVLLIPVVLRSFFLDDTVNNQEYDTLSIFSFVSFVISILIIFTFGLSLSSLVTLIFAFFVFLTNIRACFGLLARLNRAYFSTFFKVLCVFQAIFIVLACVLLIIFRPLSIENMNTEVNKQLYYGSSYRGFFEREELFDSVNAKVTKIVRTIDLEEELEGEQDKLEKGDSLVIYVPDVFSTVDDAMITLNSLALQGFEVWGFDFSTKDISYFSPFLDRFFIRSFASRLYNFFSPDDFARIKEEIVQNKVLEITAAMSIVESNEPKDIYIIAEGNSLTSAYEVQKKYSNVIKGVYGFNTKDNLDEGFLVGYGDFPCLMPIENACLGMKKQDKKIPQERAIQASKYFKEIIENEKELENIETIMELVDDNQNNITMEESNDTL